MESARNGQYTYQRQVKHHLTLKQEQTVEGG